MSWRDHCRPIIARVLAETRGQDEATIKRALFEAYPYGERAMHPYKIWLSEVRKQRGIKSKPSKKDAEKLNAYQGSLLPEVTP